MKYVAYYRVSTQQQGVSGLGLEAQENAVASYTGSLGEIVGEYTEVESGKLKDRPQLRKAIEHAKREGATLVVAKLDRLSRNVLFVATLLESGLDFVCCNMPGANRLVIQLMAIFAEQEGRDISERTSAAIKVAISRGVKWGFAKQTPRCRAIARKGGLARAKIHPEASKRLADLARAKLSRPITAPVLEAFCQMRRNGMSVPEIKPALAHQGFGDISLRWLRNLNYAVKRGLALQLMERGEGPPHAPTRRKRRVRVGKVSLIGSRGMPASVPPC